MKILLANKFYYRRGGDCIYMLNLEQLLKAHGHEVAVFAMDYPENLDTPWKRYFPQNMSKLMAFTRPFGSMEVRRKFRKLLDDFCPDVVHLNNIHTQLSPVIAKMAHERGCKVVWTLHDYKLLCPRYDCLKNGNEICEICFNGSKRACLNNNCMKGSKLASLIGFKEAEMWNRQRLEAATDIFICPSQFMADKMTEGGFSNEKMKTLCNFIDVEKCRFENADAKKSPTDCTDNTDFHVATNDGLNTDSTDDTDAMRNGDSLPQMTRMNTDGLPAKDDYYCFIGRLSHEKGAKTLIEAANELPYKLVVIGGGPLMDELKAMAHANIEFVGFKQWNEIKTLVGKARFSVIPSEWYENNPLSLIEAQCLGTPVLGARIGGIPELTGYTFSSGNVADLKAQIEKMWNGAFDYGRIAKEAQTRYDAESYYKKLIEIYNN